MQGCQRIQQKNVVVEERWEQVVTLVFQEVKEKKVFVELKQEERVLWEKKVEQRRCIPWDGHAEARNGAAAEGAVSDDARARPLLTRCTKEAIEVGPGFCDAFPALKVLDLSGALRLRSFLDLKGLANQLNSIDLSGCKELNRFEGGSVCSFSYTALQQLDLWGCTKLETARFAQHTCTAESTGTWGVVKTGRASSPSRPMQTI
ncbi:hypothetical protein L7F22_007096 [Adiantum nelumboides]|nr:hypothetical protein [Adiantum nelumboides]